MAIIIVAAAGFLALQAGNAAAFTINAEAEQGALAGNATAAAEATASAGRAVYFGVSPTGSAVPVG